MNGDSVADRALEALKSGPQSRTELIARFSRHISAERLQRAVNLLLQFGLIAEEQHETTGRPQTWYRVVP